MTDLLGWRALFGVLGPSTNTVVQPEFDDMRPRGVTNHYSRILTPDAHAVSNETFLNATLVIAENVLDAVDSVMTCSPNYLVMGMSAITFYGGPQITHPTVVYISLSYAQYLNMNYMSDAQSYDISTGILNSSGIT